MTIGIPPEGSHPAEMPTQTVPPVQPAGVDQSQPYAHVTPPVAAAPPAGKKSILPLLAIIFAGVAFLFAVIPPTSAIAWAFAVTAIVLAIVAFAKKVQQRGLAIVAIIIAPIAWLISIIVFAVSVTAGVGSALEQGFRDGMDSARPSVSASPGDEQEGPANEPQEEPAGVAAADGSSLTAPLPFGTTVSIDSWTGKFDVSFGEINWDATSVIEAENTFNADPADGMKYIMLAVTITNTDDEEWSPAGTFFWADIKLVSDGRGFSEGTLVVTPNDLSSQGELYPGGTATGNVVFEVPTDVASGVWDVDGVYVAAQ